AAFDECVATALAILDKKGRTPDAILRQEFPDPDRESAGERQNYPHARPLLPCRLRLRIAWHSAAGLPMPSGDVAPMLGRVAFLGCLRSRRSLQSTHGQ